MRKDIWKLECVLNGQNLFGKNIIKLVALSSIPEVASQLSFSKWSNPILIFLFSQDFKGLCLRYHIPKITRYNFFSDFDIKLKETNI